MNLDIFSIIVVNFFNMALFPYFKGNAQDEIDQVAVSVIPFSRVGVFGPGLGYLPSVIHLNPCQFLAFWMPYAGMHFLEIYFEFTM